MSIPVPGPRHRPGAVPTPPAPITVPAVGPGPPPARIPCEAGPLTPLLRLPGATDVLVNGPDPGPGGCQVWVDLGHGPEPTAVRIGPEEAVRSLAVRLAAAAGRRLDEAVPWADARLPGGIRLHAVLPPLAPDGTHLSLRLLRGADHDLPALVAAGTVPSGWEPELRAVIGSRASFLVTGGTGAGKTTLLAAMLGLVDPVERILLVEDVSEIVPRHPHVVRLEARPANVEGRGAVALPELLRQALRMRPDRIVVGECRGAEVRELLAALTTGHRGGCGTVHANSAADLPARLTALGTRAGLSERAVRDQALAGLDAVLHLVRTPGGRRLAEIGVPAPEPHGTGWRVLPALSVGGGPEEAGPGRERLHAVLSAAPGGPA